MTISEQKRIVDEEFDTLWTALWGPGKDVHSMEYEISKDDVESKWKSFLKRNILKYYHLHN